MVEISQDAYALFENSLSNRSLPTSEMGLLLQELPADVRAVLGVFEDPEKLAQLQGELRRTKRMRRVHAETIQEKFSEQLCRLAGVKSVDVMKYLKKACEGS
jgi:hypothetical protein